MKKKGLVLALAGLMVAGLVGSAAAQDWRIKVTGSQARRFTAKGWTGKYTFGPRSRSDLTAEQKEKIANLRLTFQEETLELHTQLARKRLEIRKLLLGESSDLSRVYGLVDEMAPIQAEIQKKAIEFSFELKSLLTEEQLEKLPGLGLGRGFGRPMGRRGPMGGCWR